MKEALSIRSTPEDACFNRDSGYELSDCWLVYRSDARFQANEVGRGCTSYHTEYL